jgi:hypothetical protein
VSDIAPIAPATIAYAPGGSRRQAIFAGINPHSREYATWAWQQMHACLEVIFAHGVSHIVTPMLTPTQLGETGDYGRQVRDWVRWGLTAAEPLAYYRRAGWAVRLVGDLDDEFQEIAAGLRVNTPQAPHTLWWTITRQYAAPWTALLGLGARTREEAIRQLYGADIPPASLLIATGKPMLNSAIVPPLLVGDLQAYWLQRPGYVLDQELFRRILYDWAYLRPTWRADKTGRAESALAQQATWESAPTLGLGQPLGDFWYPATLPDSNAE